MLPKRLVFVCLTLGVDVEMIGVRRNGSNMRLLEGRIISQLVLMMMQCVRYA